MRFLCYGIIAIACLLPMGCGRQEVAFERGMACVKSEDSDSAIEAFQDSISQGVRVRDSHLQLGCIYERMEDCDLLALWHFEQCLRMTDRDTMDFEGVRAAVERCSEKVLQRLAARGLSDEQGACQLKIRLLESHVLRQKKWIEELQRENTEYRKRLLE